jgi:hypothetical protein
MIFLHQHEMFSPVLLLKRKREKKLQSKAIDEQHTKRAMKGKYGFVERAKSKRVSRDFSFVIRSA